jgi:integrase
LFFNWLETNKLSPRTKQEYLRYFDKLSCLDNPNQESIDSFIRVNNNQVARSFLRNLKECLLEYGDKYFTPEQMVLVGKLKIKKIKGNIKKEEKEKVVLTKEQIDKLIAVFKVEQPKLMLLLSYYCALRVSELFNVRGKDFNWEQWNQNQESNGLLTIKGKGGSVNQVLVPNFLMSRVLIYTIKQFPKSKEQRRETLIFNLLDWEYAMFNGKIVNEDHKLKYDKTNYNKMYRLLKKAAQKAKVDKRVATHVFRRSFATHLHEKDWKLKEIQEHLRQKDISTTQIYTQISKKHLDDKYKKFTEED